MFFYVIFFNFQVYFLVFLTRHGCLWKLRMHPQSISTPLATKTSTRGLIYWMHYELSSFWGAKWDAVIIMLTWCLFLQTYTSIFLSWITHFAFSYCCFFTDLFQSVSNFQGFPSHNETCWFTWTWCSWSFKFNLIKIFFSFLSKQHSLVWNDEIHSKYDYINILLVHFYLWR